MLEELGLPYDLIPVNHRMDEHRTEEYASLNPNMHVPTLVDGDLVLWESMAINLYLADKYDGGLKPGNDEERGKTYQWMFWGLTEAEILLQTVLRHGKMYPEEHRDPRKAEKAEAALQKPLGILNQALAGRKYLVGENFSVADLSLSHLVSWGLRGGISFSNTPISNGGSRIA
jgi:glutathione S-transferase